MTTSPSLDAYGSNIKDVVVTYPSDEIKGHGLIMHKVSRVGMRHLNTVRYAHFFLSSILPCLHLFSLFLPLLITLSTSQ